MDELNESKSLKWLANMFPFIKDPKDETDRMNNAIHYHCTNGATKIDELQSELNKYKNMYLI